MTMTKLCNECNLTHADGPCPLCREIDEALGHYKRGLSMVPSEPVTKAVMDAVEAAFSSAYRTATNRYKAKEPRRCKICGKEFDVLNMCPDSDKLNHSRAYMLIKSFEAKREKRKPVLICIDDIDEPMRLTKEQQKEWFTHDYLRGYHDAVKDTVNGND